jgi:hypothetical protein
VRGIGFAAWALLLAVPVQAQPLRVVVTLPECSHPSWSDAELLGSLAVELRSDGVFELSRDAPSLAAVGWLTVEDACDPTQASVTLSARSATGPHTSRAMSLADVPAELHARAIALALAELWRGRWLAPAAADAATATQVEEKPRARADGATAATEPDAAPARKADESSPPKAAEPLPDERESQLKAARASAPALSLGPALRLFAQRTTLLYGARASFRGFDCEFGTAVSLGSRTDPLGTLNYGVAQVSPRTISCASTPGITASLPVRGSRSALAGALLERRRRLTLLRRWM